MKLRETPARRQKKQCTKAKNSSQQKEKGYSDSEDNISFDKIGPFSPVCNGSNITDEEISSSEDDKNDSFDKDYVPKTMCAKRSKVRRSRRSPISSDSLKESKKQKQEKSHQLPEKPINESDLELIVDKTSIAAFKEILLELPKHFADEYCRYLLALRCKYSLTPTENISKPRFSVLYSKAKVSSSNNCSICGKKLDSSNELTKHMIAEHQTPEGYKCTSCDRFYKTLPLFNHHLTFIHSTNHQCQYCNLSFQRLISLNKHLIKAHSCKHRFMCTLCNKGFAKVFQLMMHINVHTGLTPHKCQDCPKAYATNDSLKEHAKCHKKDKVQFKCDKCDKAFHTKKLLKVHLLTHGTARKFKCNLCEKAFKTPQNLVHHRISHNNAVTYRGKAKANKKTGSEKIVTSQDDEEKTEEHVADRHKETESENNVSSHVGITEPVLNSIAIELNKQPLHLEKTIFGDFEMDCESDDDEVVHELL